MAGLYRNHLLLNRLPNPFMKVLQHLMTDHRIEVAVSHIPNDSAHDELRSLQQRNQPGVGAKLLRTVLQGELEGLQLTYFKVLNG